MKLFSRPVDLYHTCYCLSGLSIAQHCKFTLEPNVVGHSDNEVIPTHPIYNVPPRAVLQAQSFFARGFDSASVASENSTDAPQDEDMLSEATTTTVSDIWNGKAD